MSNATVGDAVSLYRRMMGQKPLEPKSELAEPAGSAVCAECLNTGIVGDDGPGLRNALHEWVPCDCPHGDAYRSRRVERFHPEWTDKEMDAIDEMAKAKDVSRAAVIRAAVRLYQAVHAGACTVTWPRHNTKMSDGKPLAPSAGSAD